MKVNIFGVGRSGTKAVQLYIAYAIAQKEKKVRVNYEPYFLQTTKGPISFEGIKYDLSSDFFLKTQVSLSKKHQQFLKKMVDHKDLSVVTKFIRGNGRINAINEIIKPDLSIVVVRDLYEVLSSVLLMDWNLYDIGSGHFRLSYGIFLDKIIKEAEQKLPLTIDLNEIKKSLPKRIGFNAIYWYLMNLSAITDKEPDTFILNYKKINDIRSILNEKKISTEYDISESFFEGSKLHKDFPLITTDTSPISKIQRGLNEFMFYGRRILNKQYILKRQIVGETKEVSIIKDNNFLQIGTKQKMKINMGHNDLLQKLNEDILNRIKE